MAGAPIRVLVVDDSEDARFLVSVVLGDEPDVLLVGSADGAEGALSLVASADPDVALVDGRMPKVDGFELTPRLLAARPQLRVILLTSFLDAEVEARALRAGAVRCLLKDGWDQLGDEVRRAVAA